MVINMRCGCGNQMIKKKKEIFGELTEMYVCNKCGKEFIDSKEAERAQKSIWSKIREERKVIKFGGSNAITIPKKLEKIFPKGSVVEIDFEPEKKELIVKKIHD